MLLSFRMANVLSFRHEQRLSLVATELNSGDARPTAVREAGRPVSVVPVAGIYGANASGKSNTLAGLRWMRRAVLRSVGWVNEEHPVRRVPFALHPACAGEPSFYEVDLELDGVRYTYGFEVDNERVRAEWLHAYPKGRRQVWFDRDEDDIHFAGEGLRGEKQDLVRKTRPDSLFLSVAAEWNNEQLLPVFAWFRDNLGLVTPDKDRQRHGFTKARVVREERFREHMGRLLGQADLGVVGFDQEALERGEIRLLHRADDHTVSLDFAQESMGTRAWFALLGPLIEAFQRGTTVLVDELDASLHPALVAEVLWMFQDAVVNARGAQMVFTTHDASLLRPLAGGERILDRDMVWMCEKGSDGATQLYPLSSLRPPPRPNENLERGWLLGRFGGAPRIAPGELVREVGEALS
ncbi:ATP/GTP-binding protein [Nonomuraea sp. C10]|uniref:AAA family ATPase n=1 Tax=Nonomuraea sp. C10 TaxID=2600577 RepID=UPI0011CECE5D|nr:ATP-binding protein [Nonomuraea sp. C10]TXK34058.1 ATP-binding protein [Nonomuraea sp. C10]